MIDKLCINVVAEEAYTSSVAETVKAKGLVIRVVVVHGADLIV